MSWLSKGLSSMGSFAKKGLSAVNYVGNKASGLAHFALDNKYAQAALATDPELQIAVNGGLASADGFLKESNSLENYLSPPPPPKKPSYDGLEKTRPKKKAEPSSETMGSGRIMTPTGAPPMKPKRPDWSFDQGYLGKGGFNAGRNNTSTGLAPPKPTRPSWSFEENARSKAIKPIKPKRKKSNRYASA
jgi:hypothetical protein